MARGSAAWVLAIVSVVTFFVGALLLTVLDPVMQAVFSSAMWSSSTSYGTDALSWQKDMWLFWPSMILLGILFTIWVKTRQPT